VAQSGRTVLFVSHHMQSVSVLCQKAMYLDKGSVTYLGDVPSAIDRYLGSFEKALPQTVAPERRPGTGEFRITAITPDKEFYACADEKTIRYTIERFKPYAGQFFVSCCVVDDHGVTLLHCDSRMVGHWVEATNHYEGSLTIKTPWLKPGSYRVDMFICNAGVFDKFEQSCYLHVIPLLPYPVSGNDEATAEGVIFGDFAYASSDSDYRDNSAFHAAEQIDFTHSLVSR
jgi:lipopolysaccharide transport system ATP-binding protein